MTTAQRRARRIADATARRLLAAATAALGEESPGRGRLEDGDLHRAATTALDRMVERLVETRDPAIAWLLLTAQAGAFPAAADVVAVVRAAGLGTVRETTVALLDRALPLAARYGTADREARVTSGVIVEVDGTARSDFHNGIQRVARETVRVWLDQHELTLVAWTDSASATRDLLPRERARAGRWGGEHVPSRPVTGADREGETETDAEGRPPLVIPWRATLVLAEVPLADRCPALAALAIHSGTEVVGIGYDAIPVISADLRPLGEPNAFASYLTVVKHATRIAGISRSATAEFAGFAYALGSQGLPGPEVVEVTLPATVPAPPPGYRRTEPAVPQVLCVGRREPHKNHAAVLHAAERLWREGLEFELTLVGGDGWSTDVVDAQLSALRRAGRPVHQPGVLTDDEMWDLVRGASFSVFVSMHEGFGLPVAESLACGTPVITADYGSQAQIAEQGGAITVDPRDDDAVHAAMRTLLTEPETLARLRDQAARIPVRTWSDYAAELWDVLVEGRS